MFNFIKKLFKKKEEPKSKLDADFEYLRRKLLGSPTTENIVDREKQFTMPTDPQKFAESLKFEEDDLSTINFSALPKETRVKIRHLIFSETKQEVI